MSRWQYIKYKMLCSVFNWVNHEVYNLRNLCSHTYWTGESATKQKDEFYDECEICGKLIDTERIINVYKEYYGG